MTFEKCRKEEKKKKAMVSIGDARRKKSGNEEDAAGRRSSLVDGAYRTDDPFAFDNITEPIFAREDKLRVNDSRTALCPAALSSRPLSIRWDA